MRNEMQHDENNEGADLYVCPSFSTYQTDQQDSASKAVDEVSSIWRRMQSEFGEDDFSFLASMRRFEKNVCVEEERDGEEDEVEFEFSSLSGESWTEGEIRQMLPVFDRELVFKGDGGGVKAEMYKAVEAEMYKAVEAESVPVRKLFIVKEHEDRDGNILSSGTCKKIKSTGSFSKVWKFRDLLRFRGNSDSEVKSSSEKLMRTRSASGEYKAVSSHEMLYVKKRAVKEDGSNRPYRKGLAGFCFFPYGMNLSNNYRGWSASASFHTC